MRTNLNPLSTDLETNLKYHPYVYKHIDFYLIPVWLKDTLAAVGQNETVLDNREKINSILTAEDINFYNENVSKIYDIKGMLSLPRDIYFQSLMDTRKYPNGYPVEACNEIQSLENSISKKEGLAPFVRNIDECQPKDLWHIVTRYEIHKLADKHLISICFELCEPGCELVEQAKEDEKLAEFYISEFGIQHFANTELFKKILTV